MSEKATLCKRSYLMGWTDAVEESNAKKWISTSDRLPEPEVDVLVYCKQWHEIMVAHIQNVEGRNRGGSFWFVTATENLGFEQDEIEWWRPLPNKPEIKK